MIFDILDLFSGGSSGGGDDNRSSSNADNWSGGTDRPSTRHSALEEQVLHQSREVLRADIATLEQGGALPLLPEPEVPAAGAAVRPARGPRSFRRILLVFVAVWVLTTLVVASRQTGDSWDTSGTVDTIGTLLGWGMILTLSFLGAVFLTWGGVVLWTEIAARRKAGTVTEQRLAQVRHQFWTEREALRARLERREMSREQLIALLRGIGDEPPALIAELVRPTPRR